MTIALTWLLDTQAGQGILIAFSTALVTSAGHILARQLQKAKRTENLALIANVAAQAVNDALKAAVAAPAAQRMQLAIAAARTTIVAQAPNIENALKGELTMLVAGHVALQTLSPGGSVVNLPGANS